MFDVYTDWLTSVRKLKYEIMSETQNTPTPARNAHFSHLGAPRGCQGVVILVHMAKTRHSGRMFGWKMARTTTGFRLARPERETMSEIQNTLKLAQNPLLLIYVLLGHAKAWFYRVHMAKTRQSGRMFGRKTARKRPKRARIRATRF